MNKKMFDFNSKQRNANKTKPKQYFPSIIFSKTKINTNSIIRRLESSQTSFVS